MSCSSFSIENDNKNWKVLFDLAAMKNLDHKMAPARMLNTVDCIIA